MKNPFQSDQKQVTTGNKSEKLPVSGKNDVQAFLAKVAAMPKTTGDARLIFALDATASRQATWDVASKLQTDMFLSAQSLGGLEVQLCYFRGFAEFFSSEWHGDSAKLLGVMSGISCEAGATQLERVLRHALAENTRRKIKCVVYIGDAMEESLDAMAHLAGKLGLLSIPVFMFQERNDVQARQAFIEISRLSGGAYSQFDAASAGQLRELLRAVAVYAAGGLKALQNFSKSGSASVKLLEKQLKS